MFNRGAKIAIISVITFFTLGMSSGVHNKSAKGGEVALVSIFMNKEIGTDQIVGIGKAFNELTYGDIFNYENLMTQVHGRVFDGWMNKLPFDMKAEADVFATSGYTPNLLADVKKTRMSVTKVSCKGYIPIPEVNKKVHIKTAGALGQDIMIIKIQYDLVETKLDDRWATAKVQARMLVKVVDSEGKKVYKFVHTGISTKNFTFDNTDLNEREQIRPLRDLCKEATTKMFDTIDAGLAAGNKVYQKAQLKQ